VKVKTEAQVKVLEFSKTMMKPSQRKLVDVMILLARSGDEWAKNPAKADQVWAKMKELAVKP